MSEKLYMQNAELDADILVWEQTEIDYLEVAKQELKEMSRTTGRMIDLGTLAEGSNEELWAGATSLKKRLESGELTEERVENAIASLGDYFVPTSKGAPKRCVEDRTEKGYNDSDPAWYGQALGPQIQGAVIDEAIARRLAEGVHEGDTLENDVERAAEQSNSEYAPGAHMGSHAQEGVKTDCGSVDNEEIKLAYYNEDERAPFIKSKVGAIFELAGKELRSAAYENLQQSSRELLTHANTYFANLPGIVKKVQDLNAAGVKHVQGDHGGITVTINFVREETFHTNHYNAASGGEINNFNLDAWNIFDEYTEQEAANLLSAALATLMKITDGSLRLLVRLPTGKVTEDQLTERAA